MKLLNNFEYRKNRNCCTIKQITAIECNELTESKVP